MMAVEYGRVLGRSFGVLSRNFGAVVPFVLQGVVGLLLTGLFVLVLSLKFASLVSNLVAGGAESIDVGTIGQILPYLLVFVVVSLLLSSFFSLWGILCVRSAITKKRVELGLNFKKSFSNYFGFLGLNILLILILGLLLIPGIGFASFKDTNLMLFGVGVLYLVLWGLFAVLFLLSPYVFVFDGRGVLESIKKSFGLVKKNYGRVLVLVLIFLVVGFFYSYLLEFVGKIAVVGAVLNLLVLAPVLSLFSHSYFGSVYLEAGGKKGS